MVENVKKNLSECCKRLTEYIDSGFSGNYQGFNQRELIEDWSEIISVLSPEKAGDAIQSVLDDKLNIDNNLIESLKWIAVYIDSGCNESHLKSFNTFTVNRCALITKLLVSAGNCKATLEILVYKLRSIFLYVFINNIRRYDERSQIRADVIYERIYSPGKIKSKIQEWDPSISKFETYFYGNVKNRILEILGMIDREPGLKPEDKEGITYKDNTPEDIIDSELYWIILNGLLFLTNIRPHKKLFFISTNSFYLIDKYIDAKGFYGDNHEKKLEELYREIHDYTRFWEIRKPLKEFYSGELSLPASSVYQSKAYEDRMIRELADDEQVRNTLVDIYFNDCYVNGRIDLECTGQRLSTWNYHIKRAVQDLLNPA